MTSDRMQLLDEKSSQEVADLPTRQDLLVKKSNPGLVNGCEAGEAQNQKQNSQALYAPVGKRGNSPKKRPTEP